MTMDVALGCEEGRERCGRKRGNRGTIRSALGGAGRNRAEARAIAREQREARRRESEGWRMDPRRRCGQKRRGVGAKRSAQERKRRRARSGAEKSNGETYDSETLSARIASSSTDNPDDKVHDRPAKADSERCCGREHTRETTNALESVR